jgi:predicted Zn-dependent protease with MMP-like domain
MTKEVFEKLVAEGIDAIPEKFLQLLDNVAIVIAENPTLEQTKKLKLGHDSLLFGLYEGVSQLRRGSNYTAVLPDKITIFQKPIETVAKDEADVKRIVKETVWHELAHHFGMDEREVREAERKRKK